jgi:hypothetical protein
LAKPEIFECEVFKAVGGSLRRPLSSGRPKATASTEKVQLLTPLIFLLLFASVAPDGVLARPTVFARLPEYRDDYASEDNSVRAIDVSVDELYLQALGFEGVSPETTGRPAYHPATMLKI